MARYACALASSAHSASLFSVVSLLRNILHCSLDIVCAHLVARSRAHVDCAAYDRTKAGHWRLLWLQAPVGHHRVLVRVIRVQAAHPHFIRDKHTHEFGF